MSDLSLPSKAELWSAVGQKVEQMKGQFTGSQQKVIDWVLRAWNGIPDWVRELVTSGDVDQILLDH